MRRVASGIGKRLLGDPVNREPDTGRDSIEVTLYAELDRETSCTCLIDELLDLGRRRKRRCNAALVVATKQCQRPTKLLHAATANLLG